MEEIFKTYVEMFDMNEPMIKLKYNHSLRVKDQCIKIAKSEKLDKKQIELAKLIGLLHDYGRFDPCCCAYPPLPAAYGACWA